MRELRQHGSVRGAASNGRSYRDNEWHLIDRKPYDSLGLYWSLGLVISVYDFGLRLTTRGSYLLLPNRGSHLLPRRWMRYALLG